MSSASLPLGYLEGMDRARIEDRLRTRLEEEGNRIACAWLFGSLARDEAREGSDVDVAVLLAGDPAPGVKGLELALQEDLAEVTGEAVQLVVANRAPVDLIHRVLRDGRLLVESDRSARIAFEVDRRRRFLDLLPVLEEYRRPGGGRG